MIFQSPWGGTTSVASSVLTREAEMRHFLATLAAILLTTAFAAERALAKSVSLSQGANICAQHAGGQNSCGAGGEGIASTSPVMTPIAGSKFLDAHPAVAQLAS